MYKKQIKCKYNVQFQTSGLLQDQAASEALQDLEERYSSSHTVNPDLQALVNSPLPDSLAEFSTYGASYGDSTHVLPCSQSPPLTRHDSPSFTYPTPPASQEGLLSAGLPLLSPQDDAEQVHSPLSAAFYSTTMSSAAEIQEALSEVLPDEADVADGAELYASGCPNPHSPLSATPAPSPLSSLPASSVSSPGPGSGFSSSSFAMSPHHAGLQSQMMPNSEDPLLSSNPKDFSAGRRKFDQVQPYKLVSSQNLVDFGLGNGGVTSIVVDNNGDFKLVQTAGLQKTNVYVQASSLNPALAFRKELCLATPKMDQSSSGLGVGVINRQIGLPNSAYSQSNQMCQVRFNCKAISTSSLYAAVLLSHPRLRSTLQQVINPTKFLIHTNQSVKPGLKHKAANGSSAPIDQIKEESKCDESFASPSSFPLGSPLHKKRARLECSSYPSRLRRACDRHWDSSYTPPPMLDPSRSGPGLYARLQPSEGDPAPETLGNEGPPPRINVGTRYQATIPQLLEVEQDSKLANTEPEADHLLWDPGIDSSLTETERKLHNIL